jgi:hypothetical protein
MSTASEVVTAVRRHFGAETDNVGPEWAALDEFKTAGFGYNRADLFLVRAWGGRPKGHERVLVEVKVSRADLTRELATPDKMAALGRYAHRWYFACPSGLVRDTDDLGPGVGLLELVPGGVRETRKASRRDAELLPEPLVVEAFRRASRAEARIRQAGDGDTAAVIASLRQDLARARNAEMSARNAAARDAARLRRWLSAVAVAGGVPCTCGAPLKRATDPYRAREHTDGSTCPVGYGSPDLDALAMRLGLGDDQAEERTA